MQENKLIWSLILGLLAIIFAVTGRGIIQEESGVAAQTPAGWVELIRTPGGAYGPQTGVGKWRSLTNTGFTGPGCSYRRYRPTSGTNAHWWTESYDDSAWSDTGYRSWQPNFPVWGFIPLPEIGNSVWTASPPCCGRPYDRAWFDPLSTTLHRRRFDVSGAYVLSRARIRVFSDNVSTFYVNGTLVAEHGGAGATHEFSPSALHPGQNVLAVQLSNDCTSSNFMGLQYVLQVEYADPTPTPTPTNTPTSSPTPTSTPTNTPTPTPTPLPSWSGAVADDSGAPVGGVPVELRGRYDDCTGGTAEQVIGSTLTGATGTYSFLLAMPPNPGCGWQGVSIIEALTWNSVYRPLSASVPPPGWVQSASEIRYTWRTTGSYGGNDFVVELIPVDLTLWADYPYLVLRGPELPPPAGPLPAQVLRGRYSGPLPLGGRQIDVHTWDGSVWDTYSVFTNASGDFLLTPTFAGDPLLGTTLLGIWQAYAQVTVPGSGVYLSPDAFWWIHWFPVHGTR